MRLLAERKGDPTLPFPLFFLLTDLERDDLILANQIIPLQLREDQEVKHSFTLVPAKRTGKQVGSLVEDVLGLRRHNFNRRQD